MDEHDSQCKFRVWPDGTVQDVEDGQPYGWMSDDFMVVEAEDEESALRVAKQCEDGAFRPGG